MNGYLFAAYSFILLLLFGYIVGLHGRLRRLARELEALRLALRDEEDA
ncbi:MAG TPA: CcmD family protein [Acidobacteriota bacterium]|jgi:CcmD family protein|nr:CcmD family protein [Acidobacteriota bacterium]HNR40393.1 CcmD family protein [Acidobacteriota bacterium]HNU00864.1 CcmD family protein [Acidobacteriota bacterium]HPB27560.1 CcmD family protein [Acidobacteriota bacterium]HQO24598.1 CcmD family protein [Acidobacteriota bacterium]